MIKRIMTPRAAAVAFAASALSFAPAMADPELKQAKGGKAASVQFNFGNGVSLDYASGDWALNHQYGYNNNHGYYGNHGYHGDRGYYGDQNRTRRLRREAIRLCRRAVRHEARDRGFLRTDFEGVERVRRVGPRGFLVRAEFEFEGRRRDFDRDVTCEVRRGRVVNLHNMPRGRRGGRGYNNGYGYNSGYGYGDHSDYGYNSGYGYGDYYDDGAPINDYLKGAPEKGKKKKHTN